MRRFIVMMSALILLSIACSSGSTSRVNPAPPVSKPDPTLSSESPNSAPNDDSDNDGETFDLPEPTEVLVQPTTTFSSSDDSETSDPPEPTEVLVQPTATSSSGDDSEASDSPEPTPVICEVGGRQTGTVNWFNPQKGYGFITNNQGKDFFVHYTGILGEGLLTLEAGQKVEYCVENGNTGPMAVKVVVLKP